MIEIVSLLNPILKNSIIEFRHLILRPTKCDYINHLSKIPNKIDFKHYSQSKAQDFNV